MPEATVVRAFGPMAWRPSATDEWRLTYRHPLAQTPKLRGWVVGGSGRSQWTAFAADGSLVGSGYRDNHTDAMAAVEDALEFNHR